MPEIKNTFIKGRMNLDLDERLTPNGEYREALNIQVSTSEDSDIGTVQNLPANNLVLNQSLSSAPGVNNQLICIGSISDEKNNCLYYFIGSLNPSSTNDLNTIIKYDVDNNEITPIIIDTLGVVLEFTKTIQDQRRITGINVVDDFFIFYRRNNRAKKN
tara:strand:- start:1 stop:477 length:477 start_codon:yes stop_codon:yes gene_type:complete